MITVDAREVRDRLPALLAAVEEHGEIISIHRHGKPVAELRSPTVTQSVTADRSDPLRMHPELRAVILYDPTEPASEDEWPVESR